MKFAGGLFVGLVVGAGLGAGGTWYVLERSTDETVTAASEALDAAPQKAGKRKKKRRSRTRSSGGSTGSAGSDEEWIDEPIPELSAADLAQGHEGDALKPRPRTLDMGSAGEARDLSQAEIDGTIRGRADEITRCIIDARGAAEVRGRVVVGVVVGPDGSPIAARVEAPRWLLAHGLGRCARKTLMGLRFPAVGRDTVVTVPFDVE